MKLLNHFWSFVVRTLGNETGALTFTVVKRFKPQSGIRRGVIDITFDATGPTFTITIADLKLQGQIMNLTLPGHIDGFVLGVVAVAGNKTIQIVVREEADAAGALQLADAADIDTKVVRVEYLGF